MPATPQRCAAVARFTPFLVVCACALLLVACSGRTTATITPPTATTGGITLSLDQKHYTSHQAIGITMNNKDNTTYYAKTGLSACTYLQLEFYDTAKKSWLAVDGCVSVNPPHVLVISPNSSLPFTLAPGDSSNDPNAWVPGVYRVSLRYGTAADGTGAQVVVYSQGFNITS